MEGKIVVIATNNLKMNYSLCGADIKATPGGQGKTKPLSRHALWDSVFMRTEQSQIS